MYYQIPALELSLSVPLVLQAVFRRAGARVWFMTSCCCLVEFGFSCFNHASIESWFANYSVLDILQCAWASKLTRPEHREAMEYCQEENEKQETKQCRWAEGHCQRNLGFTPPQQCHKLISSMPRWIEAVIKAKGAPTKYWVHTQ